ncbi:MAG: helix-turn-helix transcriptional regulator [Acidimicrobiales bacterium]|nr:helix-turn-helix transcriptional regulator [Acidimicrobiales bacterium]
MSTSEFRIYNGKSLGASIRLLREEAGLSQAQLAKAVQIDRSYLSELENGEMVEQVTRIVNLLAQLGARLVVVSAEW